MWALVEIHTLQKTFLFEFDSGTTNDFLSFGAEYSTVKHSMEDSNNADLGSVNMTYLGANVKFRF